MHGQPIHRVAGFGGLWDEGEIDAHGAPRKFLWKRRDLSIGKTRRQRGRGHVCRIEGWVWGARLSEVFGCSSVGQ